MKRIILTVVFCLATALHAQTTIPVFPWPTFVPLFDIDLHEWYSTFVADVFAPDEPEEEVHPETISIPELLLDPDIRASLEPRIIQEEENGWILLSCYRESDLHRYWYKLVALIESKFWHDWKIVHFSGFHITCIFVDEDTFYNGPSIGDDDPPEHPSEEEVRDRFAENFENYVDRYLNGELHDRAHADWSDVNYFLGAIRILPNQTPFNRFLRGPIGVVEAEAALWPSSPVVTRDIATNVSYLNNDDVNLIIDTTLDLANETALPGELVEVVIPNNTTGVNFTLRLPEQEKVINYINGQIEVYNVLPILSQLVDLIADFWSPVIGVSDQIREFQRVALNDLTRYFNDQTHLITDFEENGYTVGLIETCDDWLRLAVYLVWGIAEPFQINGSTDGLLMAMADRYPTITRPSDCDGPVDPGEPVVIPAPPTDPETEPEPVVVIDPDAPATLEYRRQRSVTIVHGVLVRRNYYVTVVRNALGGEIARYTGMTDLHGRIIGHPDRIRRRPETSREERRRRRND